MKSLAKKLLAAFACAALLTVPVAASETEEAAALTVESITNHQPADMITEGLTLPTGYTWTASPEGIVDTETGAVTRDLFTDKTVTLTATSGGETKGTFTLTVKSQKTNVIVSDNFAYDYEENKDPLAQTEFPFEHNGTATGDTTNPHKIVAETDGNQYLLLDMRSTTNASAKSAVLKALKNFSYDKNIYISFKYKHVKSNLTNQDAHGVHLVANKTNGTSTLAAVAYQNGASFGLKAGYYYSNGYVYSSYAGDGTDAWKTALLKWDSVDKTVSVSDNGGTSFNATKNTITDTISGFIVSPTSGSSDNGQFLLDDLVVYTETLPLTLESITGHQPANMITDSLTLDDSYQWTASPEEVVNTATGAVTRDPFEDRNVALTATKDGTEKTFNLVVKSLRTKVLARDNFAYDYAENTDPLTQSGFPFEHSTSTSIDTDQQNRILTENENHYLQLDMTYSGSEATKKEAKRTILTALKSFKYDETVYIAFRFKYVSTDKTNGIYFQALQNGTEKNLASLGYYNTTLGFKAGYVYDNGFVYSSYRADGTDAWETGIIKYNLGDKTSYVSKDGVNFTENKNGAFDGIENFRLSPMSIGSDCGKLLIDDFVVYSEAEYPAEIAIEDNKVSVTGETTGGMLVIAQYSEEGNTLVSAKVVTDGFASVDIGAVASGNTVKCFFWEQNSLRPLAASKNVTTTTAGGLN